MAPLLLLLLLVKIYWMQVAFAGLQIYYYRQPKPTNTGPPQSWEVDGLATWVSSSAFIDNLDCNTTSNDGAGISWTGQVPISPYWILTLAKGKRLALESFTNANLGIYTCYDSATNESLTVNITSANPAILALYNTITTEKGTTAQLKVYASGIPNPSSADILWFKMGPGGNKTKLTEPVVNFSSDHRTLLLADVQESDGGFYRCIVTLSGTSVLSNLYLNISTPPSLMGHQTNGYTSGCLPGYTQNGNNSFCTDINECQTKNGGCEQLCYNNNGSFVCSCFDGFALNLNGFCQGQSQILMSMTEFILVAVIVVLVVCLATVSLSFAIYCFYVQQQSKVKAYTVNSANSLERYNVQPYLTASGHRCDPVYSNISK